MKKISLALALIFVFTCMMLASCGSSEDQSSAAESVVSKTESKVESSSSVAESSAADSSVADSSAADESSEAPADISGDNIAEGKAYTISKLYQQGGADINWGWDDNAPIAYPDENGKSLTDGVVAAAESDYQDEAWAGFHAGCPDYIANGYSSITVDLAETKAITGVVLYNGTQKLGGGISAPDAVEVFVSEDGENFTSVGKATPVNAADSSVDTTKIACTANARYVQIRMTGAGWMFVSEVEVFAA